MSSKKINIDKDAIGDSNYRYKMSEILLKYEGQGNGQRTIFLNIADISEEIKRDQEIIISFIVYSLGCKFIINKEKQIVLYGTHTKETIQNTIFDFITKFVICPNCKNPETFFTLSKGKNEFDIEMNCTACPKKSQILPTKINAKIAKIIYKNL